jgi:Flp pilus assembly protein TadB
MNRKKLAALVLIWVLLTPAAFFAGSQPAQTQNSANNTSAASNSDSSATTAQNRTVRYTRRQDAQRRRSYEREATSRRRSGISKKEVAFMAAIAGTSMGIGALAGGAQGLAIGAIVGGWGAYASHRLWRWIR